MKKIFYMMALLMMSTATTFAQEKVNPVIKDFGGIYDIEEATVKPDLKDYHIVIDLVTKKESAEVLSSSMNNVARLINLHAVGGAEPENIHVVLAIHGPMTYTIMKNSAYKEKFGVDNPNIALIQALHKSGVKLTVCGQSLLGRKVSTNEVMDEVDIATSMLTTVTTYQLKGYAMLKF